MPQHLLDLRRLGPAAACAIALVGFTAPAGAQTGGGATADPNGRLEPPAASPQATAGTSAAKTGTAPRPKPRLVTCRTACAGLDVVRPGGVVRVTGTDMTGVVSVAFQGGKGTGDDTAGPAVPVGPDAVDVVVPAGTVSGPVRVTDAAGRRSRVSARSITVVAGASRVSAAGARTDARVDIGKVYFRGPHRATLSVFVPEGPSRRVTIDLARVADGAAVGHWELDVPGGTVQSVSWKGAVGSRVQPDGRYRFQVRGPLPGATAAQADAPLTPSFTFLGHIFPIRGRHDMGGSAARFGTGRTGHSHQGHDVFAACGTPLVAARGGTVKFRATQSAAGNYVVIDGFGTGTDYAYMHLKAPALVKKGDTVATGQLIGEVGDTGDASGCHLHFELWSAPGWYSGGSPFDPFPSLKRWDATS